MFKAVTACSEKKQEKDITNDLISKSNAKLGVYRPTAGILYASCPHDSEKLKEILIGISEAFPGIEIIGGTVVGGFTDESGYIKDGYFLCLLVSDTTTLSTGCIRNLSALINSNRFTQTFRAYLEANFSCKDITACLVCSAYKNVDGDRLITAVQEVLSEQCLIFGGMAADYWSEHDIANFSKKIPPAEKTLLFFAKDGIITVEDDSLVFLIFQGNLTVKYAVSYGWSDIGMLYPARSEGLFLTEIDGKNPQTFLSELKHPLSLEDYNHVEYALWFHVPGKDPFIRDVFFDKASGKYSTNGTGLPPQAHISFSFPSKEKVLREFQNCLVKLDGQNSLVIAATCCAHQVVLGQDISQEYAEMMKFFQNTPLLCGYVFNEFGPSITNRKAMAHSCSSVLFCLQEENVGNDEKEGSVYSFLVEIMSEQRREIQSLQKQLRFFEESKMYKSKQLTEDCLGILLHRSHKSLSGHAEQISKCLKDYYKNSGMKPPYAISRNRLIEHLTALKKMPKAIGDE